MKISTILSRKSSRVITIGPDQTLQEVVARLVEHDIGALVVMSEAGDLVGIISERDVIRRLSQDENALSHGVSEVMTRDVITGAPQDEIISVAHTMTEKHFRHLPIFDGRRLIGIVSIGDILKAQRDQYRGEIDTLETRIMAGSEE